MIAYIAAAKLKNIALYMTDFRKIIENCRQDMLKKE